jgi:hypothetical protein
MINASDNIFTIIALMPINIPLLLKGKAPHSEIFIRNLQEQSLKDLHILLERIMWNSLA